MIKYRIVLQTIILSVMISVAVRAAGNEQPFRFAGSFGETATSTAKAGNIACYAQGPCVRIADIKDPNNPRRIGFLPFDRFVDQLQIFGNALYVVNHNPSGCVIGVYDVSDPKHPRPCRNLRFPDDEGNLRIHVEIHGKIMWVIQGTYHQSLLEAYDLSNPGNPVKLNLVSAIDCDGSMKDVSRGITYSFTNDDGIKIHDETTSNTRVSPALGIDSWIIQILPNKTALYVLTKEKLRIFDVSNPRRPAEAKALALKQKDDTEDSKYHIVLTGSILWVWEGWRYPLLNSCYDVSDPLQPVVREMKEHTQPLLPQPDWMPPMGEIQDVQTSGSVAYLSDRSNGLWIVNFADPRQCALMGRIKIKDGLNHLVRIGAFLYASSSRRELVTMNVSDPTSPTLASTLELPDAIRSMSNSGRFIYAAAGPAGMLVIDTANQADPKLASTYPTTSDAVDVAMSEKCAYIADGKVHAISIADPLHPVPVKDIDAGIEAARIMIAGNRLFVFPDLREQVLDAEEEGSENDGCCVDISGLSSASLPISKFLFWGDQLTFAGTTLVTSHLAKTGPYGTERSGTISLYDLSRPPYAGIETIRPLAGPCNVFLRGNVLFVSLSRGGFMLYRR
ncbi:hypothetical protein LLG95_13635 [bacterium]|nr:hypothetical protein [bacterium]